MKKTKSNIKVMSIILATIVVCSACQKNQLEETAQMPKNIELVIGQRCIARVFVDQKSPLPSGAEFSSNTSTEIHSTVVIDSVTYEYNTTYTSNISTATDYILRQDVFKNWVSNHPEIVESRNDTLFALSPGECEISTVYLDINGNHTATCQVKVTGIDISTDTIYAHEGDSVVIFECNAPSGYWINYEFESENSNHYAAGQIYKGNNRWISESKCVSLSPISNYSLSKTILAEMNGVHVYCEPLNIDLRIPIVVSECGNEKPF